MTSPANVLKIDAMPASHRDVVFRAVDALLVAAAPERTSELREMWKHYGPTFALLDDKPGFHVEGGAFASVIFTERTLHQIWIIGFAAWRAFEAYGGPIHFLGIHQSPCEMKELSESLGQAEADEAFDKLILKAEELQKINHPQQFAWPSDAPRPDRAAFKTTSDKAAFDLTCIAAAFVFLHEVRHLTLRHESAGFKTWAEEEPECDRFARHFLLESASEYAVQSGYPVEGVLSKRMMGIALGAFVIVCFTSVNHRGGSASHPNVSSRIENLMKPIDVPESDYAWAFSASLILAKLRIENRLPSTIQVTSARNFFFRLLDLI